MPLQLSHIPDALDTDDYHLAAETLARSLERARELEGDSLETLISALMPDDLCPVLRKILTSALPQLAKDQQFVEGGAPGSVTRIRQRLQTLAALRAELSIADSDLTLAAAIRLVQSQREGREDQAAAYREALLSRLSHSEYAHRLESTSDGAVPVEQAVAYFRRLASTGNLAAIHPQVLPGGAVQPSRSQHCCTGASLPPVVVGADEVIKQVLLYAHQLAPPLLSLTVTFTDRQLFQDYRAGLLQIVDVFLASALRMVVVLLAAVAHLVTDCFFLHVMLRSVRRHGHRGEPDHLALPARVLRINQHQGTVRLAA